MSETNLKQHYRLSEAVKIVKEITGEEPHACTLHRWAKNGLSGIRLRTIFACGSRRTTHRWLTEFFEAVAEAKNPNTATLAKDKQPKHTGKMSASEANSFLEREGI